MKISLRS